MINDEALLSDLVKIIEERSGIINPMIIRRTFASGKNTYELLSTTENMSKTLLKLRFFNSLNLFIEPQREPNQKPLWEDEF
jgi:hypothetical protein